MSRPMTVKVNSRNQIVVPGEARERLKIKPGDRLIVDVQGDMLLLLREPDNYVEYMAGLGKEVWEGIDSDLHLRGEREAWGGSVATSKPVRDAAPTPKGTNQALHKQMAAAAEALLDDYSRDKELIAFTALDGESFDAKG